MTSTSDRKKEVTSTEEGVLWRKPRSTTSPVVFLCAHSTDALLSELVRHVHFSFVLTLRRCREQFCARSQESFLHSVPTGWEETGKTLVRTSAVSLPTTQQKRLRHEGDRAVGGFWRLLQEDESVDICRHFLPVSVCLSLTFISWN